MLATLGVKYDPLEFESLNDFDTSRRFLAMHADAIDGLGRVILDHGLENELGICLLHRHFKLAVDEILLEHASAGGSQIAPVSVSGVERDAVVPYMWRMMERDGGCEWTPLEFVDRASLNEEVRRALDALPYHRAFLGDFAAALVAASVQGVFGLAMHHRQTIEFDRTQSVLLETESETERWMRIVPVDRSRCGSPEWTQTLWRFSPTGSELAAACTQHGCAGHCALHG